jgi:hypothetical protein
VAPGGKMKHSGIFLQNALVENERVSETLIRIKNILDETQFYPDNT